MYEITVHVPETISAVHATAAMNSWMDCFVLVEPKDIQQTARVVRKA